jgi:hypothetical protein
VSFAGRGIDLDAEIWDDEVSVNFRAEWSTGSEHPKASQQQQYGSNRHGLVDQVLGFAG